MIWVHWQLYRLKLVTFSNKDHVGQDKHGYDHSSSQADSHMEDSNNEEEDKEEEVDMGKVIINALKEFKNT